MDSELLKRKKEIDAELEEIMEMEDDSINVKSNMTIAAVAKLIAILDEHVTDLGEIAHKKKYYDEGLTKALQNTVSELSVAFSKIEPPIINIAPQLKFDIQPLQNIAGKISEQNGTLINLIGKFNNNQNEGLYRLIYSLVEKQNAFLEKEVKQIDITKNLTEIKEAINNRPTEFKSKVTKYDDRSNRIEEITTTIKK